MCLAPTHFSNDGYKLSHCRRRLLTRTTRSQIEFNLNMGEGVCVCAPVKCSYRKLHYATGRQPFEHALCDVYMEGIHYTTGNLRTTIVAAGIVCIYNL